MTLPPMPSHRLSPLLTLRPAAQAAVLCVALAGCAGMQSYREGQSALADGKVVSGIGKLKEAVDKDPANVEYRRAYFSEREQAINNLMRQADVAIATGSFDAARQAYRQVLQLEAGNDRATEFRTCLAQIARIGRFRLDALLGPKTKLVCVTHASNILGTINPIPAIAERVHAVGARLCVDAVAYAPHRAVDVVASGADYYVFSFYKTYGPHFAVLALWALRQAHRAFVVDERRGEWLKAAFHLHPFLSCRPRNRTPPTPMPFLEAAQTIHLPLYILDP